MTAIFPVFLLIADKYDAAMSADRLLSSFFDNKLPMTVPPFLPTGIRAEALCLVLRLLDKPSATLTTMLWIIWLLAAVNNLVATAVGFNGVFRNA